MAKYILVDCLNLAFRAKHTQHNGNIDMKIGMSLHIMFNSIRYVTKKFKSDHVVLCLEGRSWRKDAYPEYKAHRKVKQLAKPIREQEDDELFLEAITEFQTYMVEKTNATTLQCPVAEADDMIVTWIDMHPNDEHVIISSDSDFYQLLADNVSIFNGVTEEHTTLDGIYKNGKPVIDKKTNKPKVVPEPEYMLFEKCIRGDSTDNIMSAYPGCRTKSTKNKVGIEGAYADRLSQGYEWNNFFLQKWTDHNDVQHRVLDRYNENKKLIDLHAQPDEIKLQCIDAVLQATGVEPIRNVGIHFLKFCSVWDLNKISQYPDEFAKILNSKYAGKYKAEAITS